MMRAITAVTKVVTYWFRMTLGFRPHAAPPCSTGVRSEEYFSPGRDEDDDITYSCFDMPQLYAIFVRVLPACFTSSTTFLQYQCSARKRNADGDERYFIKFPVTPKKCAMRASCRRLPVSIMSAWLPLKCQPPSIVPKPWRRFNATRQREYPSP